MNTKIYRDFDMTSENTPLQEEKGKSVTGLQKRENSVQIAYEINCAKCRRLNRFWVKFRYFGSITLSGLAEFQTDSENRLKQDGWIQSGADWLCEKHGSELMKIAAPVIL